MSILDSSQAAQVDIELYTKPAILPRWIGKERLGICRLPRKGEDDVSDGCCCEAFLLLVLSRNFQTLSRKRNGSPQGFFLYSPAGSRVARFRFRSCWLVGWPAGLACELGEGRRQRAAEGEGQLRRSLSGSCKAGKEIKNASASAV